MAVFKTMPGEISKNPHMGLGQSNSRFKIQDPRSSNQAPRKQAPV